MRITRTHKKRAYSRIAGAKSQSAMEYLMTYGWAILIIAIVLGALFSLGVFSLSNLSPRAQPGTCEVLRTSAVLSLAGQCNGLLPEYVGGFNGQSSYVLGPLPTNSLSVTLASWFLEKANVGAVETLIGDQNGYGVAAYGGCTAGTVDLVQQAQFFLCPDYAITTNTWYSVVMTLQQPDSSHVVYQLYVNGVLEYTSPNEVLPNSPTAMLIGSGDAPSVQMFDGLISNVQVYNTTLSQAEITALYDEGIGGAPIDLNNLVGWWPLNGNANDYSGFSNNGNAVSVAYTNSWTSGYSAP